MEERPEPIGPQRSIPFRIWGWSALAVGVGILFLALVFRTSPRVASSPEMVDPPALDIVLPPLSFPPLTGGDQPSGSAQWAGNVTLINFWGPWCLPCRLEMPDLARTQARYRADSFRFISVSCNQSVNGSLPQLKQETLDALGHLNLDFPTFCDPGGASRRRLASVAGIQEFSYPTTILLDRQGVMRGLWIGYDAQYAGQMERQIEKLIRANKPG